MEKVAEVQNEIEAANASETEIDMSNLKAVVKEIRRETCKDKNMPRDDGIRVKKKARMRPRPLCCAYRKRPGVKSDRTCACRHIRCSEYMILESESEEI